MAWTPIASSELFASTSDYLRGPQNAFSSSEETRLAKQMQPTLYMTVVEALIPESLENISALVKNFPLAPKFRCFRSHRPNFLWIKAVQERLFTPTDLTG
jgi:hypothetical protein